MTEHQKVSYKLYWGTWFVLLLLTLGMVFFGSSSIPRVILVLFLLVAMLVKAGLIGGHFMHLRFERSGLALMVALGILLTSAALFFVLIPDALRIHELSTR